MKLNIVKEKSIQTWLKKYCAQRGYKFIKLNPSMYNGMPDREIMTTFGTTVYLELKSEGKELRPLQQQWGEWLLKSGHRYRVIDRIDDENVNEIIAFIEQDNPNYVYVK